MITEWLNKIRVYTGYNRDGELQDRYEFSGDGSGDFEMHNEKCDLDVLDRYVNYCKEQIALAEKYRKNEVLTQNIMIGFRACVECDWQGDEKECLDDEQLCPVCWGYTDIKWKTVVTKDVQA